MKAALTSLCVLLLIAVSYLSVSVIVLDPPRANVAAWFVLAAALILQTLLTLTAVHVAAPPAPLRLVVCAGAVALAGIAVWRVRATTGGTHFEGYNLLIGGMLGVQAALTLIVEGRAVIARGLMH